jgi:hypothetical protein
MDPRSPYHRLEGRGRGRTGAEVGGGGGGAETSGGALRPCRPSGRRGGRGRRFVYVRVRLGGATFISSRALNSLFCMNHFAESVAQNYYFF